MAVETLETPRVKRSGRDTALLIGNIMHIFDFFKLNFLFDGHSRFIGNCEKYHGEILCTLYPFPLSDDIWQTYSTVL